MTLYRKGIKRLLDIVISAAALLVLSPVLLVVALLVRIRLGGPVIFKQSRPGRHGKIFVLYKFRTMLDATDSSGEQLPDEKRLTAFGKMLRSTSLDELPELWNVIRGDMSIVGPRPLRIEYLPLYSRQQNRRHEVLPGITGLAQVSGRNSIDWPARFKLDVQYVDTISLKLDLMIVLRTVISVLKRSDISSDGHATMEPFKGEA